MGGLANKGQGFLKRCTETKQFVTDSPRKRLLSITMIIIPNTLSSSLNDKPSGWGADELSKHIDNCRANQFATFDRKLEVKRLQKIDNCFRKIFINSVNLRPWFPMQFLLRSHSNFLASCTLAMSGHSFETNALIRLCLESAAYGFYIGADEVRANLWLNRGENASTKKLAIKEFTHGNMKQHVRNSAPKLAEIYEELYEQSIDSGAHPNERGFFSNALVTETPEMTEIGQVYLQGDGVMLDYALKSTARAGVWGLGIFQLLYPEKWMLLGIKDELEQLRINM